jgi:hypothetical protein
MRPGHTAQFVLACCCLVAGPVFGQTPAPDLSPIAIVPYDSKNPGAAASVSGSLQVTGGKAIIQSNGHVTAGDHPVVVTLTHRGELRLCATTRVSLTADANQADEDRSGLMMALDRGALEANYTTGRNSDVILTPDFRITISGPGAASVQVRLGPKGDTCVDNRGANAPYVSVSSIFEGGVYRVQPDQRVMFQHGSLNEVVDKEKESCGCPAEPAANEANPFPLAQSAGLAPLGKAPENATVPGEVHAQLTAQLNYNGDKPEAAKAAAAPVATAPAPVAKKGFLSRVGGFFKRLFGG